MCGLVAQIKKTDDGVPTHDTVKGMFASQISRGQQGLGYIAFDDCVASYVRRESRSEIEKVMDKNTRRSIIFHHRIPTSTPNFADCTHPIKVSHEELLYDYYLIHNGMISNDSLLHERHLEMGYVYSTTVKSSVQTSNSYHSRVQFNDSEALAIDVSRFLEGLQEGIESRGSIAFITARCEKETGKVLTVFFGRNSSPLTMKLTDNSLVLRSEGEKDEVERNTLYWLDMETFAVDSKRCMIGEMISVRHDPSQGHSYGHPSGSQFHDRDWDDEDPVPNGKPYRRPAEVQVVTSANAPVRKFKNDFDEIAADEEIADQWVTQQIVRVNVTIDDLEVQVETLNDERQAYLDQGMVGEADQTMDMIRSLEEDIQKFQLDRELLLNGDFDEYAEQ